VAGGCAGVIVELEVPVLVVDVPRYWLKTKIRTMITARTTIPIVQFRFILVLRERGPSS
jgi:hypothetical protein